MTENMKGLNEVYGVAIAPGGAIVVAEGGEGDVLVLSGTEIKVAARGLGRPTGVAAAQDGSCYVCEAHNGRVVHINGGVSTVLEGLKDPQGILLLGDNLYVVDSAAHEVVSYSLTTQKRETIASNLPVGAPPGVVPKVLAGIPGLLPGPLRPFAGIAADSSGTIYVAADGEGSVLALSRA
jgi:DNA-binding beta-propeller fold protein YncE